MKALRGPGYLQPSLKDLDGSRYLPSHPSSNPKASLSHPPYTPSVYCRPQTVGPPELGFNFPFCFALLAAQSSQSVLADEYSAGPLQARGY